MCILVVIKQKTTHHLISEKDYLLMGTKITKIGITNDKISARGGLPFFLRYIEKIRLYSLVSGIR